jgi:transaldolase
MLKRKFRIKIFADGADKSSMVQVAARGLCPRIPSVVSVFAGRVADCGVDPVPLMQSALGALASRPRTELPWASCRELYNVIQAEQAGCHIISVTHDLLSKLSLLGKSLEEFSLDTVKMFYKDAQSAGLEI